MALVHEIDAVEMSAHINSHAYNGDALEVTPTDVDLELRSWNPGSASAGTEGVVSNESDTISYVIPHMHSSGSASGKFFFPDGQPATIAPRVQLWGTLRDMGGVLVWRMQF